MTRRRWGSVLRAGGFILVVVLSGFLGNLSSAWTEPLYSSTTTLLVGDISGGAALSEQDLNTSSRTTARYRELIRSETVLGPVRDTVYGRGQWQLLKDRVHVEAGANGLPFLYVAVYSTTPEGAQALGGAVAQEVVRLGLDGPAEPDVTASQVAAEKAAKLERAIDQAEARISRLEAKAKTARLARTLALLQAQINDEADLILEWQDSYVAALSSIPGSPDSVQILMPASTNSTRLGPDARLRTVLGAALGALIGVVTQFPRSRSMASRHQRSRSRAGEKLASPGNPTRRGRRRRLDPWVRESLSS